MSSFTSFTSRAGDVCLSSHLDPGDVWLSLSELGLVCLQSLSELGHVCLQSLSELGHVCLQSLSELGLVRL